MKRLPLLLLVAGLGIFIVAPLLGMAGTVLGMVGAFDTLDANGISDPKALSGHIGTVLMSTMVGLIVSGTIGVPLMLAALVLHFAARKPREPRAIP